MKKVINYLTQEWVSVIFNNTGYPAPLLLRATTSKRKRHTLALAFLMLLTPAFLFSQLQIQNKGFRLGVEAGYDIPDFRENYQQLDYTGGLKLGAFADYYFADFIGIGIDYDFMVNKPVSLIPDTLYYTPGLQATPTNTEYNKIIRQFLGIGPNVKIGAGDRIELELAGRVGFGKINGGDILVSAVDPNFPNPTDWHLLHTGYNDLGLAGKLKAKVNVKVNQNLSLHAGAYYTRQFSAHLDDNLDIRGIGNVGMQYKENVFDPHPNTGINNVVGTTLPNVVDQSNCVDISSFGLTAGLTFKFPKKCKEVVEVPCPCEDKVKKKKAKKKKDCPCEEKVVKKNPCQGKKTCCPEDKHKVIVTVTDKFTGMAIPNADVILKDMAGDIVGTGVSNGYGAADMGTYKHGTYVAEGIVYGVPTTVATITEDEFVEGSIIQKKVLYDDLRFILKGKTINKNTRRAEPNVVASLMNGMSGSVKQDGSDKKGAFSFHLDPNTNYEISGKKDKRLSDIEKVTTMGLYRSTTLFVELKLGVENIDCNSGLALDIHYDHDKSFLRTASKVELDRVVRFMTDHPAVMVELGSHTSALGSDSYNYKLSQRRAKSAVSYIMSKGIPSYRILAKGYGETQLINRCADGVVCPEKLHQQNRRTEVKLICK